MSKRNYGIDILKIIATFFVIGIHHFRSVNFYNYNINFSLDYVFAISLHTLFFTCIPLFLMISGYLLNSRKIDSSHYKKINYFIIEVILIYSIVVFVSLLYSKEFTIIRYFHTLIIRLLNINYYVALYLSVYLLAPYINKLYFSLNNKEKLILIILLIILVSLPVTINALPFIDFFEIELTYIRPFLYYTLGLYIYDKRPKINKYYLLISVIACILIYSTILSKGLAGNKFSYVLGNYENIFILLISIGIFLIFYDIKFDNFLFSKQLQFFANSSLSFYIAGEVLSDRIVDNLLKYNNVLISDLILFPQKILLSILFSFPIALIVFYINFHIKRYLKFS